MRFLQSAGTSLLDFFSLLRSIFMMVKVFVDYYVDFQLKHQRLGYIMIYYTTIFQYYLK